MNATSINLLTAPGNQTYKVGAPMLAVNLPTYSWIPSQSHTNFSHMLVSAPSFITIAGNPLAVQIYSTSTLSTGVYSITIKSTEINSGLFNLASFSLTVTCVSSISPSPSLSDVTYFIGKPAKNVLLTYVLTPVGCPNDLTFSINQADGTSLPPSVTFAGSSIVIETT
jgi:hypothetical protein